MSFASSFTHIKAKAYDTYGKDPAKMLLHTGAVGWILASAAYITGVMVNDEISKKEKKFLIPQEIADAAINILSFYTITLGATKIANKLVTTGKLITKPVANFVKKNVETITAKVKLGDFTTDLDDVVRNDAEIKKSYYDFKNGVKVIASTLGAVLSSNFITPYLRNHIGASVQKRSLAQTQATKSPALTVLNPSNGCLPVRVLKASTVYKSNRIGIDEYKKQATAKASYPTTSSSLKI